MVLENLSVEHISLVLMSLSLTPTISFHEHELALKEIQNLPICVTLLIRGIIVNNVLVDTRASVCVAPMSTLHCVGSKKSNYREVPSLYRPLTTQGDQA